jgi:hypothetical protein
VARTPVTNGGCTVCTRGTAHVALATAPDVCKMPSGAPAPFPNLATSDLLKGGTTLTLIESEPIWTTDGYLGPPSEPAHAGTRGGVISGTYRAETRAIGYSRDVWVEGAAIVRSLDPTSQNHGNARGVVLPILSSIGPMTVVTQTPSGVRTRMDCRRTQVARAFLKLRESDPETSRKALEMLERCNPAQLDALYGIFRYPTAQDHIKAILGGGHVLIEDGGAYVDGVPGGAKGDGDGTRGAKKRISSHDDKGTPYIDDRDARGLDLPRGHVLLGRTWARDRQTVSDRTGPPIGSRVQLERHGVGDLVSVVGHMADYYRYSRTGENQGPIGSARETDAEPIVIPRSEVASTKHVCP